jgi:3-oxoacyl-[acyl-carrier protein] reductase
MLAIDLSGKVALVAGAGHRPPRPGIGRATSLGLAEAGAAVVCVDLDPDRAEAVAAEVRRAGGESIAVVADLRHGDAAAASVQAAVDAFGRLDICLDIIGEATWSSFLDCPEDQWDWTVATCLRQLYLTFQAAARQMVAQGGGGVLGAVASVDGLSSAPYHAAYGVAKAGIVHLVKTLAEELGPAGIRANAVAPGAVWSAQAGEAGPPRELSTPLRRPGPEDIARALIFLSCDLARCVTGQTLAVDGGASTKGVFPDRVDTFRERAGAPWAPASGPA